MAVGQNQWDPILGKVNSPPILVYFSGWIGMFTGGTKCDQVFQVDSSNHGVLRSPCPEPQVSRSNETRRVACVWLA